MRSFLEKAGSFRRRDLIRREISAPMLGGTDIVSLNSD